MAFTSWYHYTMFENHRDLDILIDLIVLLEKLRILDEDDVDFIYSKWWSTLGQEIT